MFIKLLIILFAIFIAYLLFSNTIQEGAKGTMKTGKKGGIKKKDKNDAKDKKDTKDKNDAKDKKDDKSTKTSATGQKPADDNEDGEDGADESVGAVKKNVTNDAGEPLPTAAQLPRMVNELQKQLQITQTQVAALSAENTTVAASSVSDEPDDGFTE